MTLKSINPFNQKLVAEYEENGKRQVEDIITLSGKVYKTWSRTNFPQRADLMAHAAEQLFSGKKEYARTKQFSS
jgi:acyl-CoA reductase-like NAD-dependent aldehyde dehydrogenase